MKRKSGNGVTAVARVADGVSRPRSREALLQDRVEKEGPFLTRGRHGIALGVEAGLLRGGLLRNTRKRDVGLSRLGTNLGVRLGARYRGGCGSRRRFKRPGAPTGGKRERNRKQPGQGDGSTDRQQERAPIPLCFTYNNRAATLCRQSPVSAKSVSAKSCGRIAACFQAF